MRLVVANPWGESVPHEDLRRPSLIGSEALESAGQLVGRYLHIEDLRKVGAVSAHGIEVPGRVCAIVPAVARADDQQFFLVEGGRQRQRLQVAIGEDTYAAAGP